MKLGSSLIAVLLYMVPSVHAQLLATIEPIPRDSVGLPPQPPIITLLGIVSYGKLVTDPSILPKGRPVSRVIFEVLRVKDSPAGSLGSVESSVTLELDDQARVVKQITNNWGHEDDTVHRYVDGRLVATETTFPNTNKPMFWNYWAYDSQGKLSEYRRGSGADLQNHELSFRYDTMGRIQRFETRQGSSDQPFSRTEFRYSKDATEVSRITSYAAGNIVDLTKYVLNDKGLVVRVDLGSQGRAKTDQAKTLLLRYDEKGRLIEQTTDAKMFSTSGAEHDLPPGTISITYDDKAHTKTTRYAIANEGKLESVVTMNQEGVTLGYTLAGPDGPFSVNLECEYDGFGNWTSCREIVDSEGRKRVEKMSRRTITYR